MSSVQASGATARRGALWDHGLSWLLQSAESSLGFRGNTGSVVAMIESGGPGGFGDDHEHVTDSMIGWGRAMVSAPARWRPLWARWRRLDLGSQRIATAHYASVVLPQGIEEAFRIADDRGDGSPARRVSCATVALLLVGSEATERLLKAARLLDEHPRGWALTEPGRQAEGILRGPRETAERAVREAHRRWESTEERQLETWVG